VNWVNSKELTRQILCGGEDEKRYFEQAQRSCFSGEKEKGDVEVLK